MKNRKIIFNELSLSHKEDLCFEGGFLPRTVPGDPLPSSFNHYFQILQEIPNKISPYHKASIRKWFDKAFSNHSYQHILPEIDKLNYGELNTTLSVFSILMQSYRWDTLPAESENFTIDQLSFPDALYFPWKRLSDRIDLPYANTYWSVIACNWKLKNVPSGKTYTNNDLTSDNFELLYTWLPEPYHSELEEFILSFVEMEARGALAITAIIKSIDCIINKHDVELVNQLTTLNDHIQLMSSVFSKRIRKQKISLENWRDIIHVPFAWGLLDENGQKLEGASGMQVGAIAALNSFLSIPETSNIGRATRHSRMYLRPQQKRFLSLLDELSPFVGEYVRISGNFDIIGAFNACINSLLRWRVSHKKRGEMYLAHNVDEDTPQIATGLTLPQGGNQRRISDLFVHDMEERIQETKNAKIEAI